MSARRSARRYGCSRVVHGFTYLGVIFLVALLGITSLGTGIVWRIEQQRVREAELLFIGQELRRAIDSYRAAGPALPQPWPRTLDEMLRDSRLPTVRRHLRKVYRDPFTGRREWGLVRTPQGGIVGVYSLSPGKPVLRNSLTAPGLTIAGNESYADWVFVGQGAPALVRDPKTGAWSAPAAAVPAPVTSPAATTGAPGRQGSDPSGAARTDVTPTAQSATTVPSTGTSAGPAPVAQATPPRSTANCARIIANDQRICSEQLAKFGAEAGAGCQQTAEMRAAQCNAGQDITTQLGVRYF